MILFFFHNREFFLVYRSIIWCETNKLWRNASKVKCCELMEWLRNLRAANEDVNNGGMRQRDARLGCKAELGRTIIEAGGNTNRNRGGDQIETGEDTKERLFQENIRLWRAKNRIRKPASPNRTPGLTAIAEARIHMLENCKRKKLLNKLDMRGNLWETNFLPSFPSSAVCKS